MDPDEALKRVRHAEKVFRAAPCQSQEERTAAIHLVDAFEALDNWISRGGFLPQDWQPKK